MSGPVALDDSEWPATRPDRVLRIMDVLLALMGALLMAPAMLVIASLVLITLGRPVLFVQRRTGRGTASFDLIKFRSMTDAKDKSGQLLSDELRTTRLGRILRRTRLDELPELWNVLKGDMSLIGPRPLLPQTIQNMGVEGLWRCSVRPGLTGWAQICGNSTLTDRQKLSLDLWYIRHRSLSQDMLIFVRTIQLVLQGERIDDERLEAAMHRPETPMRDTISRERSRDNSTEQAD